jgi:hypothetical protein
VLGSYRQITDKVLRQIIPKMTGKPPLLAFQESAMLIDKFSPAWIQAERCDPRALSVAKRHYRGEPGTIHESGGGGRRMRSSM